MIGSLMSRMGMAEKLSVAQLQKAVQDGTLPAYVGVPLIQDKMQQEQAARNAAAGMQQQGQPPIAEQVMQAAKAQETQQGIDAAPSNLPEQGFAGGGIVAFASGDLVDDDETDDSLEERRQISRRRALTADAAARMQQGVESGEGFGISAALPQAGYKGEGIKPPTDADQSRKYNVGNLRPSGFNYPGQVGISKGGFAMFDTPESGIAALQRDIGIKLGRGLDTPTKFISVYAPASDNNDVKAYSKNVASMLGIGPNDKIPNTPEAKQLLAQAIIRQEGAHKATAAFAGGGIVALADGGDIYSPEGIMVSGPDTTSGETPSTSLGKLFNPEYKPFDEKAWEKQYGKKKPEPKAEAKPTAVSDADIAAKVAADLEKEKPVAGIDTAVKSAAAPEDDIRKKYLEMLTKREAGSANQRSIDNYTALLQAGLGMMASKSLTPLGGIGEGASSGIAAKLAAEKTRAAEEAATLKGYGNLYDIEQTAAYRKELAGQGQAAQVKKQQFGIMANLEQKTRAQISASLDKSIDATSMTPEQKQAKVDQLTAQALSRLPTYTAAYKAYNGFDYNAAPVIPGAVDYSSTYGLTPKPKQ